MLHNIDACYPPFSFNRGDDKNVNQEVLRRLRLVLNSHYDLNPSKKFELISAIERILKD